MGIRQRLSVVPILPLIVGVLLICTVFALLMSGQENTRLQDIRRALEKEKAGKLKSHVDLAFSMVQDLKRSGASQEQCLEALGNLRFGRNGCVWVHSYDRNGHEDPVMLMHPLTPSMEGRNLAAFSCRQLCRTIRHQGRTHSIDAGEAAHVEDVHPYVEMNRKCREKGEGDVTYYWPKTRQGSGDTAEGYLKIAYVKLLSDWGWVIGASEHADEIDTLMARKESELEGEFRTLLVGLSCGFAVVLLLLLWGRGRFANPAGTPWIRQAADQAESIIQGDLSRRLDLDRNDELGRLARRLDELAVSLGERMAVIDRLAAGDLSQELPNSDRDAFSRALQTMISGLSEVIGRISQAAALVAGGSRQVFTSSQLLSVGATEQAASLIEITSSITELGSQTRTNAENANQANFHAGEARDAAEKGFAHMQEMVAAMAEINDSSQQISKIIKVIDDIAFQTNLLALNAAVEAARAGRHGKGFAVVAEEVRNLAARSAKAAKETTELIEGSAQKVRNGSEIANQTSEVLKEIVTGITRVTDLVGEIASASKEQAMGISQVREGLEQIDSVTQQNTAAAEQAATIAGELSSQATNMKQLLEHFKIEAIDPDPMAEEGDSARANPEPLTAPSATSLSIPPAPILPAPEEDIELPGESREPDPRTVIALDDGEFGKY
jgi:methyl-accepting chemotaxis protein